MAIFDHLSGSNIWRPTITTPAIGSPITAQSIADGRQDLINNDVYLKNYSDDIESRVEALESIYTPGSEFITVKSPATNSITDVEGNKFLSLELVENNAPDIFDIEFDFYIRISKKGVYQVDFGGYTSTTASSGPVQHSVYLLNYGYSDWDDTMSAGALIDAGLTVTGKRLWMSASTIKRLGARNASWYRLMFGIRNYDTPEPVTANFVMHVRKIGEY